jgi:Secretion system C-terminal sorting domain
MKKILIPAFTFLSLVSIAQNKLYLNLGSHNETTDPQIYNHPSSSADFDAFKPVLQTMMDSIIDKKVKWNMQVESNFILGVIKYDNGATSTGDILERADTSQYIAVDPHNHFVAGSGLGSNPYNYTDLTKLLDSTGIHQWQVMGGFLWDTLDWSHTYDHWTNWRTNFPGNTFPTWTWKPDIIWGPGSMGHVDDINAYGVWKPSSALNHAQFVTHDANEPLTVIGNGCAWVITDTTAANPDWIVNSIIAYANYAQAQPYSVDKMFNATLQTNFKHYMTAGYLNKVMYVLNGIQAYVDAGKIEYKTIQEKYAYWYGTHALNSTINHVEECDNINVGYNEIENNVSFNIFPNPASNSITIELYETGTKNILEVSDMSGKKVLSVNLNYHLQEINIGMLESGIYTMVININNGSVSAQKLIKL